LDTWGESIQQPYLAYFKWNENGNTYERCYLSPFYNLDKRHPPLWFYKLILSKFFSAYKKWQKTFDALDLPYDLQIWLYNPGYIRSEIISYRMSAAGEQKQFVWESDFEKLFPYSKFNSPNYDLKKFDWILADDAIVHFESDLEYADFTEDELLEDGFIKKVQNNDEIYYSKRIGDIWIGRRKGKFTNETKSILQPYFAPPVG